MTKSNDSTPVLHLSSLFRGLYNRVARELEVDPSYVSRVARGERKSAEVQAALNREIKALLRHADGQRVDGLGLDGNSVAGHGAKLKNRKLKSLSSADLKKLMHDEDGADGRKDGADGRKPSRKNRAAQPHLAGRNKAPGKQPPA